MLRLALRNLFRQRARTALTLAAIVCGVVGIVASGGFVQDILVQLGEAVIHSQSGHLQVAREGFFTYGSRKPDEYRITDARALTERAAKVPGVDAVTSRIGFGGLVGNGRADLGVFVQGVEPDGERKLGSLLMLTAGRRLEPRDTYGIMLGRGVADALQLKVGDQATVLANMPGGGLNTLEFEVVGIFQTFSRDFDARAAQVPLAAAQELLGTDGVNTVVVTLRETRDTERAAAALAGALRGAGLEVKTWQELNDFYAKTVTLYQTQFGALRLIILLMVLLSVANSVNIGALERTGEFGTMMALGNRHRDVVRLIVTEGVMLGLIGAVLGIALGGGLALAVSAVGIPMPPPPNSNMGYVATIRVVPGELALGFAVGLVATVAASLLPARRVMRIPLVDALRQNV